jgi:hypothetical protein
LDDQEILIGVENGDPSQIITEDITSNASPVPIGKHNHYVYCFLLNEDEDKLWAGDMTSTVVEYTRVSRLKWVKHKVYPDLGIGYVFSLCDLGDLVFAGGNNNYNNIRMINSLDQKVIGDIIHTPVKYIYSLQICPLSTSEVYLTATGIGKSYSSNKTDIFDVSKLCEKSVIERVFTNPTHHQNELRKQLAKFNQVNQTKNLEIQDKKLQQEQIINKSKTKKNPTQMVPPEQEIHHLKDKLSDKEHQLKNQTKENQNLNDQVKELSNELNMSKGIIASLQDNNSKLKSQLEKKNNQLAQARSNENELNSQIKKLMKTIQDKIKEIENHHNITSSLELNFKNFINKNKELLNDKNQLKKELSEITKKYVLLRKKPKTMLMIQKTLLVQSQRSNICNKCSGSKVKDSDNDDEEVNNNEYIDELKSKNKKLESSLECFRDENRKMIIDNEGLKEENHTIKRKYDKVLKQVDAAYESIKYW